LEILLPNKGFCNLVSIPLDKFKGDTLGLHRAAKLVARANYRQTIVDLRDGILQEAWHLNNEHLHLCGVSLMGVATRPDMSSYDYRRLERTATAAAYSMAKELGTAYPKNVTTIKPEGCAIGTNTVLTDRGLKTYEELLKYSTNSDTEWKSVDGFKALGSNKPLIKVFDNGVKEVVKITTSYGFEQTCTLNHPWAVKGNGWVPAGDLSVKDILEVDTSCKMVNNVVNLTIPEVLKGAKPGLTLPEVLSSDFSWLLGFYFGNGTYDKTTNRFGFCSEYEHILVKLSGIVEDLFSIEGTSIDKVDGKSMYTYSFTSVDIAELFRLNALFKYAEGSDSINAIPELVRTSKHSILGFLAGLIDSDGCITKNGVTKLIKISTTHQLFSESIQDSALSCGILLSRSHISRNTTKGRVEYDCTIQSTSVFDQECFNTIKGMSYKVSANKLPDTKWRHDGGRKMSIYVKSLEILETPVQTYGIEVDEVHWYLASGGIKSHNTQSKCYDSTEGMHKPLGRYIFNNVAFSIHDPLLNLLKAANYNVFNHPYDSTAALVTFPVEYKDVHFQKVNGIDVNMDTAIDQLEAYKKLMDSYCQQNVSCTISYSVDETEDIVEWLYNNWDNYVAVSFLFRNDPTKTAKDLGYPYLPQEVVTKEDYEAYVAKLLPVDLEAANSSEELLDDGCANGVCPIR
jgi:intein/homing endonuclease